MTEAMLTRASWTDETDPEELKKYTCAELPTEMPTITVHAAPELLPKMQKSRKKVKRLKRSVIHYDFNLKRK